MRDDIARSSNMVVIAPDPAIQKVNLSGNWLARYYAIIRTAYTLSKYQPAPLRCTPQMHGRRQDH